MLGSRSRDARPNLLEQFQPFPAQTVLERHKAGCVAARPRQGINETSANRVGDTREHDWHGARRLQQRRHSRGATREDDIRRECDQFRRVFASVGVIACEPAIFDLHVAAVGPAQLLQTLCERCHAGLQVRIIRGSADREHADAPHPLALLRPRRERPRNRCAAERG
jgi:hypothetical protein